MDPTKKSKRLDDSLLVVGVLRGKIGKLLDNINHLLDLYLDLGKKLRVYTSRDKVSMGQKNSI